MKFSFREMPSKSELKAQVDLAWEETLPGQTGILLTEVKGMLDQVGLNLPNYKVREILDNLKKENKTDGDQLSKVAFESVSSLYHSDCHILSDDSSPSHTVYNNIHFTPT